MLKIEKVDVYGWEAAIRSMRNPMNSWDKSDSKWYSIGAPGLNQASANNRYLTEKYCIGENDLKLMKSLSKAGNDHGKFLRMINVTCDITAPLYFFKEYDTYKVATVANSCSTMYTIHKKEFTLDDFSHEHLISLFDLLDIVNKLNVYREKFLETKDKIWWWQMIQLLPTSYNQKRTVQLNYQVLKNMYNARKLHKLDEWRTFADWCLTLPYFKEICVGELNNNE